MAAERSIPYLIDIYDRQRERKAYTSEHVRTMSISVEAFAIAQVPAKRWCMVNALGIVYVIVIIRCFAASDARYPLTAESAE